MSFLKKFTSLKDVKARSFLLYLWALVGGISLTIGSVYCIKSLIETIERQNTPKVIINILSDLSGVVQWTWVSIEYEVENASLIYFNDQLIERYSSLPSGSKRFTQYIDLTSLKTAITIRGRNKYRYDDKTIIITREKTPEEIQEEKDMQEKARIAEEEAKVQREQEEKERIAKEEARMAEEENARLAQEKARIAEEKRQEEQRVAEERAYKKSFQHIPYKRLSKDPDSYIGTKVYYKGKIIQAISDDWVDFFRLGVTNLWYWYRGDIVWVFTSKTDFVEEDIIEVRGEITGNYCYANTIGGEMCIPSLKVEFIK